MRLKLRAVKQGPHVRVTVFVGGLTSKDERFEGTDESELTLANSGVLCFEEGEWPLFLAALLRGSDSSCKVEMDRDPSLFQTAAGSSGIIEKGI